jgi:hypothetical protein
LARKAGEYANVWNIRALDSFRITAEGAYSEMYKQIQGVATDVARTLYPDVISTYPFKHFRSILLHPLSDPISDEP